MRSQQFIQPRIGSHGEIVEALVGARGHRLQLAAETGNALAFLFRPLQASQESSPAALRLKISHSRTGPCIEILKCKGMFDARRNTSLQLHA